jgi:O-antigen/teichoic acid export membrane protein
MQAGFLNSKLRGRIRIIGFNTLSQMIFPVSGVILSWAVFHYCNAGLWGQFVNILLILNFAPHIMSWGNKDYLLRRFSISPSAAARAWRNALSSRLLLIIPLLLFIILYPVGRELKLYVFLWCVARFIYQSYDVVILYKRKFLYTVAFEIMALALMVFAILYEQKMLDLERLVFFFMIAEMMKAMFMIILCYKDFPLFEKLKLDIAYFGSAFYFFILGFSGLVQSRTDLLCINYFMPADKVGQFQVLTAFLLYTQAMSAFILSPFIKNIYRLNGKQVYKVAMKLFSAGIIIVILALVMIYFIIGRFYHFDIEIVTLALGGLSVLPIYFYLPFVYELYKMQRQSNVLILNISGIIIGFACNIIFIRFYPGGINGALLATALVQWLFIPAYLYFRKTNISPGLTNNINVPV